MKHAAAAILLAAVVASPSGVPAAARANFDHQYRAYGDLLAKHVEGARVDYQALKADRAALERVVQAFGQVTADELRGWSREQQLAYWINAYNLFTLDAIVDHYPIDGGFFSFLSLSPKNSIRQIDGVWTKLKWRAARGEVTLDGIEHGIIRKEFDEPLIHFAVNCASISCPPLAGEPYRAGTLTAQLERAARAYLASPEGVEASGTTLQVSSIFDWYGEDFVPRFASKGPAGKDEKTRAILAVLQAYAPAPVASAARSDAASVRFKSYNWGLNDTANRS